MIYASGTIHVSADGVAEKRVTMHPLEYRLSWAIGNKTGNGLWFPAAKAPMLHAGVEEGNRIFGPGTHWLDVRPA